MIWRYDPLILLTGITAENHYSWFTDIARELRGFTHTVVISFLDMYGKTRRQLQRVSEEHSVEFRPPELAERREIAVHMAELAAENGMRLEACCEPDLVHGLVRPGRCINADRLSQAGACFHDSPRNRPTRPGCGCSASVDIGAYDSCLSGCVYCYATRGAATAAKRHSRHDPASPFLINPVSSTKEVDTVSES